MFFNESTFYFHINNVLFIQCITCIYFKLSYFCITRKSLIKLKKVFFLLFPLVVTHFHFRHNILSSCSLD